MEQEQVLVSERHEGRRALALVLPCRGGVECRDREGPGGGGAGLQSGKLPERDRAVISR